MSGEDACRPGPNCNEGVRLAKNGSGHNTDYLMCFAIVFCICTVYIWPQNWLYLVYTHNLYIWLKHAMYTYLYWVERKNVFFHALPNGEVGVQTLARLTQDLNADHLLNIFKSGQIAPGEPPCPCNRCGDSSAQENKLAKLGDAIAISNFKLSINHPLHFQE